jgi:tetratricopeptide (TPR) repeat protein
VTPRFTMLEPLREFGLELMSQAGEAHVVRDRATAYYLGLAEYARSLAHTSRYRESQQLLLAEHPNLRAALHWALGRRDVDTSTRMCAALHHFWNSYPREGEQAAAATLAIAEGYPPSTSYALTLNCAGYLAYVLGDHATADRFMTRCLEMDDALGRVTDRTYMVIAPGILAWILFYRGDYARGDAYHLMALAEAERAGDEWSQAMVRMNIGCMEMQKGNYDQAHRTLEDALRRHRQVGQAWGIAVTLRHLGELYARVGESERGQKVLAECLALAEESQMTEQIASCEHVLAMLAHGQDDDQKALGHLEAALALESELGGHRHIIEIAETLARIALHAGKAGHALRLGGFATAQRTRLTELATPFQRAAFEAITRQARQMLAPADAEAAWAEGEAMLSDRAFASAGQAILEMKSGVEIFSTPL